MRKTIELKVRDEKTISADELKSRVKKVIGITFVDYNACSDGKTGNLIFDTNDSYDLQELGHVISGAGYNVVIHSYERPTMERTVLDAIYALPANLNDLYHAAIKPIKKRVDRWNDIRHTESLARKRKKQGEQE